MEKLLTLCTLIQLYEGMQSNKIEMGKHFLQYVHLFGFSPARIFFKRFLHETLLTLHRCMNSRCVFNSDLV